MNTIRYRPIIRQDGEGRVERGLEEPADELQKMFERYMERVEDEIDNIIYPQFKDCYPLALEVLEGSKPELHQVNNLPLLYSEGKKAFGIAAGSFISAAYATIDQQLITYQAESDRKLDIGQYLPQDKTLILRTDTNLAGFFAEGTVINLSSSDWLGQCNQGLCINAGYSSNNFASMNEGVAINFGEIEYSPSQSIFINFGEIENVKLTSKSPYFLLFLSRGEGLKPDYDWEALKQEVDEDKNLLTWKEIERDERAYEFFRQMEEELGGPLDKKIEFLNEIGSKEDGKTSVEVIENEVKRLLGDHD